MGLQPRGPSNLENSALTTPMTPEPQLIMTNFATLRELCLEKHWLEVAQLAKLELQIPVAKGDCAYHAVLDGLKGWGQLNQAEVDDVIDLWLAACHELRQDEGMNPGLRILQRDIQDQRSAMPKWAIFASWCTPESAASTCPHLVDAIVRKALKGSLGKN